MSHPARVDQLSVLNTRPVTGSLQVFFDLLSCRKSDVSFGEPHLIDFSGACDPVRGCQVWGCIFWWIDKADGSHVGSDNNGLTEELIPQLVRVQLGVDDGECPHVVGPCSG